MSSSAQPGTGIIDIQVTSTDRAAVAPWAGELANSLIKAAGDKFATLSLVDTPATPTTPYAPNRKVTLAITLIIALAAAIVSVILAAAFRARRDGAAEIRERFGIRVLAEIPALPQRIATLEPQQLALNARALPVVDSLQTLAPASRISSPTSPSPGSRSYPREVREGKSFVAANLAWLLGALENETLLLDANARHPTAHQMLELAAAPGIDELEANNLGSVMQRTARENLGFIAAGRPDRHPAEVASAHLPFLLKQLDGHDVTLVVDTPAMTGAAETVIYTAGCGAVLFVIDARRRDFADVEQLLMTLNDRKIEVLGVVINRVRRRSDRSAHLVAPGPRSQPDHTAPPRTRAFRPRSCARRAGVDRTGAFTNLTPPARVVRNEASRPDVRASPHRSDPARSRTLAYGGVPRLTRPFRSPGRNRYPRQVDDTSLHGALGASVVERGASVRVMIRWNRS